MTGNPIIAGAGRRRRVLDHRRRHRAFDDERFGPRHPRADGGDNERAAQEADSRRRNLVCIK